jgi:hypothetical protein
MKKELLNYAAITAISFSLFATSCSSSEEGEESSANTIEEEDTTGTGLMTEDPRKEQIGLPTPNDLFSIIGQIGGDVNLELLNSVDNLGSYEGKKAQAMGFGVYSADLAYASSFGGIGPDALKYFSCIKTLGDAMGISSAFDETLAEVEKNIEDGKKILEISDKTYIDSYFYLVENERGATLALISAGAWIESMHIITNLSPSYSENSPIVDRIAEQKYQLDHLIGFMYPYESEESVAQAIADLEEVRSLYDGVQEEDTGDGTTLKNNGKKFVLEGGDLKMTEQLYNDIKEKVAALRSSITVINS